MCLAIPARVLEVNGDEALIEVQGVRHAANLADKFDVPSLPAGLLHG